MNRGLAEIRYSCTGFPCVRFGAFLLVPAAALATLLASSSSLGAPPRKARLAVASVPSGALVSVHHTPQPAEHGGRMVAGGTPLVREFDFGKGQRLWLEVERRGFEPRMVEVTPATGTVTVHLQPLDGGPGESAPVVRVAVVDPDVSVIVRGFSAEQRSEEDSQAASRALGEGLRALAADRFQVVTLEAGAPRPVWRDGRTAMELLDPIRLPYLAAPPRLETRAAREALRALGEAAQVDALLLVDGKQNQETGGMKAGKVGIMAAGTATSFASGYSRAAAAGDSFFTYTVYLPSFSEGIALRAVLVHCATGEVLWVNKGLWRPLPWDRPERVREVAGDLLTGMAALAAAEPGVVQEQEDS